MKLTTKQKQNKFRQDIYEMGRNGAIVKTHDNTYQIVVCVRDVVFDYYSSTESWSSRGSGSRYKGKGKNDLISLLNKLSKTESCRLEDDMLRQANHNHMMVDLMSEEPLIVQVEANPKGILEEIAFNFLRRRGCSIFRADK